MVSPVCTTTDPNDPGKMQFHIGTDHSGVSSANGQVCITPPGEAEQCFPFTTGYDVYTDFNDHATDCIIGEMETNMVPAYTPETVITCYSGAEFVQVNDAPNSNPVQATTIPLDVCDAMYFGRNQPVRYMFTAEVTGAESGTYYIRTQGTDQVMDPCYDYNGAESDDYTCAPGFVTYVINMAVAEEGDPCETAPPVASGTVAASYDSCQPPNAFNGFVCPVLCAGEDSTQTGILKCNDGTWEDSIVCTGAETNAPTDVPSMAPTDVPTKTPTRSPTKTPTKTPTASPTIVPTMSPTQSPVPCSTTKDDDVIFLMDASGSVEGNEWSMMLNFVEHTVLEFIPDESRVAVAAYSTEGYLHFDLETYGMTTTDRAVIASAVLDAPKISGATHTLSGLEFVYEHVIAPQTVVTPAPGTPDRVTKLFLITDGTSGQDTCSIVKTLTDANVHVTLVTIGDDWHLETHYDCLVNSPEDHINLFAGYEAMSSIFAPVESSLCAELTAFPSMPPTANPTTLSPTSIPTPTPTWNPTPEPTREPMLAAECRLAAGVDEAHQAHCDRCSTESECESYRAYCVWEASPEPTSEAPEGSGSGAGEGTCWGSGWGSGHEEQTASCKVGAEEQIGGCYVGAVNDPSPWNAGSTLEYCAEGGCCDGVCGEPCGEEVTTTLAARLSEAEATTPAAATPSRG